MTRCKHCGRVITEVEENYYEDECEVCHVDNERIMELVEEISVPVEEEVLNEHA